MAMPTPPPVHLAPGQQPTQEQIQQIQAHFRTEAERMGISYEEYIEKVKEQAMAQQKAQMEAQQQQQQQQQHQEPIQPGPPKPEAIAVAKFLLSQELKPRTCIFQEKRKDMFRGICHCPS
jgi:translocation protein SEC62